MSDEATRELVLRYFACINSEDWAGLREVWHEQIEIRAVGARPRHGRDEAVSLYPRLFAPWAAHHDEPTRIVVAGNVVTAEVTFTGTMPDGKVLSFDAVDVIDVEDGEIKRLTNWYDVAYVREQLQPRSV
jgi:ketosteroid isomerase-like protein